MIRIVNLRNYKPLPDEILIKVDRSSPVGNPFVMQFEQQRNMVCDRYDENFNMLMQKKLFAEYINYIITELKSHNVALGCWCFPKRCHAETIKKYIEGVL